MEHKTDGSFLLTKKMTFVPHSEKRIIKVINIDSYNAKKVPVTRFYKPISRIFEKLP